MSATVYEGPIRAGDDFGRLTTTGEPFRRGRNWYWNCLCECGNSKAICVGNLSASKRKPTRSCGCLAADRHYRKHGYAVSGCIKAYNVYCKMLDRCQNPADKNFHRYGGRGIKVCERWSGEGGFENFVADMGPKPTPKHSVDRKDNDGDYSPENCRWADKKTQRRNSRAVMLLTYQSRTQSRADWADELGIPRTTLATRLRGGWTVDESLGTPAQPVGTNHLDSRRNKHVASSGT